VIARENQRKLLGIGAIADGTTDAKNASVDGPKTQVLNPTRPKVRKCKFLELRWLQFLLLERSRIFRSRAEDRKQFKLLIYWQFGS
jgi:hypothetical protein